MYVGILQNDMYIVYVTVGARFIKIDSNISVDYIRTGKNEHGMH